MDAVPLADAKARLSELVERAAGGDPVLITRRGRPVARIAGLDNARKRIDAAELRALTDAMPLQEETAADLVRRMRDERY